jgi:hypothetical protein
MAIDPKFLGGPVPGSSLTGTPGNTPWENPPQFAAVEDVIDFYTERLTDEDVAESIVKALEGNLTVDMIAEQIVTSAGMNGVHTYDAGILVTPVVRELIMYIGDLYAVGYVDSYESSARKKKVPSMLAKQIAKELAQEIKQPSMSNMGDRVSSRASGLMARPTIMMEE